MVETLPSNAGGAGLIPGLGAGIPHALWPGSQNIKQKQYCNNFNKDFKKITFLSCYPCGSGSCWKVLAGVKCTAAQ